MAHTDGSKYVESMIDEIGIYLVNNDDALIGEMTITNADSWSLEEHTNLETWFEGKGKVNFSFDATFSGEPLPDRGFCGSIIKASIRGKIIDENGKWRIVECKSSGAKVTDF